jgi:hypothetical protein
MKDESEINKACDRSCDMTDRMHRNGSKYQGMSYEEGIRDALDWVLENVEEDPTEES